MQVREDPATTRADAYPYGGEISSLRIVRLQVQFRVPTDSAHVGQAFGAERGALLRRVWQVVLNERQLNEPPQVLPRSCRDQTGVRPVWQVRAEIVASLEHLPEETGVEVSGLQQCASEYARSADTYTANAPEGHEQVDVQDLQQGFEQRGASQGEWNGKGRGSTKEIT